MGSVSGVCDDDIMLDTAVQDSATAGALQELPQIPAAAALSIVERDALPGGVHRWRGRLGCHVHAQPSPANLNP